MARSQRASVAKRGIGKGSFGSVKGRAHKLRVREEKRIAEEKAKRQAIRNAKRRAQRAKAKAKAEAEKAANPPDGVAATT